MPVSAIPILTWDQFFKARHAEAKAVEDARSCLAHMGWTLDCDHTHYIATKPKRRDGAPSARPLRVYAKNLDGIFALIQAELDRTSPSVVPIAVIT